MAATLCKYDLRKEDLFVLSWARVRRVRRGSLFSELLMCGGGVHSILLLPLVARCLETIDVCIWHMFVFMSVIVTVWGSVGILLCSAVVKNSVFSLGLLKCVCVVDVMDVVFSVCIVMRRAACARVWEV